MIETETLRRMYIDEQQSATQISAVTGLSRNAIIGRLARAGHKKGRPHTAYKPRAKKPSHLNFAFGGSEPKPPERLPDESPVQADFRALNLLDLGVGDCRWPQGDGPFVFCGCPVRIKTYCSYHERVARPTYGRPVGL